MKYKRIILFTGLPGSGKTTAADMLHKRVGGARINADQVRASISSDLKFGVEDRRVQAYRMGALCGLALQTPPAISIYSEEFLNRLNSIVIADFVCPTHEMMKEFLWGARMSTSDYLFNSVWMNTISPDQSRFPDTAKMFEPPVNPTITLDGYHDPFLMAEAVDRIINTLNLPLKASDK
jgi:adenylylsulfate kinase-like enzyme